MRYSAASWRRVCSVSLVGPELLQLRLSPCRKLGFDTHILCVSDSIVQDLLLVKRGMGAAILPV